MGPWGTAIPMDPWTFGGPTSLHQRERDDVRAGRDGDVLPAVEDVGHRRRLPLRVRVWNCHSRAPVAASTAVSAPPSSPKNTRPPAVASIAAPGVDALPVCGSSHAIAPVRTSIARSTFWPPFAGDAPRVAGVIGPAWLPRRRRPRVDGAFLERLHVVEAGRRAERGREPVGRSLHRGTHASCPPASASDRVQHGPAVAADLARPCQLLHEWPGQQQRAVGPIEHVEEPVAVGVQQQLPRLAAAMSCRPAPAVCWASQSQTSCGVYWKCHFSRPVSGSSARIESEYRLSPTRWRPS